MKLIVAAVKDRAIDAYLEPIFSQSNFAAIRLFRDAVSQADTAFHKHPEDYDLYQLGEFDNQTGTFTQGEKPILLEIGKNVAQAAIHHIDNPRAVKGN